MTNEEAIYLLRNTGWLAPSLEPIDEAIEMACEALRKTENSSEIPNNCDGCKEGQEDCCGCPFVKRDEPQTCSVNGRPYDCGNCEYHKCTADEPQTERKE